ncbi:kinase-like protein [Rhizodiscina lignyota]|uniref:non-specific serine/threonine protein kinase n=1 Tax=Rhizodiscina lignyota TaxID=1504668 RepID=A0A9P4ID12_9PEZI|nr:kinase-like protein [Rhizodiscina lignyota]
MAEKESDKYDVLEKIGQGSFGVINKVRKKSDGQILCRKEISYLRMTPKEREQLSAEIQILKELRHPNIVAYFNRAHDRDTADVHLYMEYCGNGDLGRVIKQLKRESKYADEEFVWSMFSQIVSALYRCHYGEDPPEVGGLRNLLGGSREIKPPRANSRMVLHRDLKPENIFLGEDNSVKLGDFGLSKIIASHDFASTYVGTPFYMSPEICAAERYTLYSDIWSLGCIMYELCAKEPPFNAKTHFDLIQKIKAGKTAPLPVIYSQELKNVIGSCLRTDPSRRPDTAQLINLPIVRLMRKQTEVVEFGNQLKQEKSMASRKAKELEDRVRNVNAEMEKSRHEIDEKLRREWEVRAQLEIDRRVQEHIKKLNELYPDEVEKEVQKRLAERLVELKNQGPAYVQSCTPTKPRSNSTNTDLDEDGYISRNGGQSFSTLGEASEFPSQTDLSDLSDLHIESPLLSKKAPRPSLPGNQPPKRPTRTPFTRAKTMMDTANQHSPMDVHMASPSPMTIGALALSPRRTQPASKWEPTNASSLPNISDIEDSDADDTDYDAAIDELDGIPVLPSPTRNADTTDPFKPLKPRPNSAVPVVTTSPTRKTTTAPASPTRPSPRKTGAAPATSNSTANGKSSETTGTGLKSKKGLPYEDMIRQAMRNQIQGRTLVELAQARAGGRDIPSRGAGSDSEMEPASKVRTRTTVPEEPPKWDPTRDEMPSPFLKKTAPRPVR